MLEKELSSLEHNFCSTCPIEELVRFVEDKLPGCEAKNVAVAKNYDTDRKRREEFVARAEVIEVLRQYGLDQSVIDRLERVIGTDLEQKKETRIYRLPVINHFSNRRLPKGYAYKGGAARALLERALGLDPESQPRDVDVVRKAWELSSSYLDGSVGQNFMPADMEFGDGVEEIESSEFYSLFGSIPRQLAAGSGILYP